MTNLQEIQRTEKHDNDTTIIGTRVAKPNCENFHRQKSHFLKKKKNYKEEFPGDPVFRTPCFHCQGPGFNPWLGNKDLIPSVQQKKRKKKLQSKTSYLRA